MSLVHSEAVQPCAGSFVNHVVNAGAVFNGDDMFFKKLLFEKWLVEDMRFGFVVAVFRRKAFHRMTCWLIRLYILL